HAVAVAGADDDAQAGVAEVVVELLRGWVLLVLVQDLAELFPVLADGLRCRLLVQDVARVADPAEASVHADNADSLDSADLFLGLGHNLHLSLFETPSSGPYGVAAEDAGRPAGQAGNGEGAPVPA